MGEDDSDDDENSKSWIQEMKSKAKTMKPRPVVGWNQDSKKEKDDVTMTVTTDESQGEEEGFRKV